MNYVCISNYVSLSKLDPFYRLRDTTDETVKLSDQYKISVCVTSYCFRK